MKPSLIVWWSSMPNRWKSAITIILPLLFNSTIHSEDTGIETSSKQEVKVVVEQTFIDTSNIYAAWLSSKGSYEFILKQDKDYYWITTLNGFKKQNVMKNVKKRKSVLMKIAIKLK